MPTNIKELWQRVTAFLLAIETADNTTAEQKSVANELQVDVDEQIRSYDSRCCYCGMPTEAEPDSAGDRVCEACNDARH